MDNSTYKFENIQQKPQLGTEAWAMMLRFDDQASNPQELVLSMAYPVAAIRVFINSQTSSKRTLELYPNYTTDDKGNAFKHSFWAALNTVDPLVQKNLAKAFTDAHEEEPSQPPIEKTMDLFNNAVGIEIGDRFPITSLTQSPVIITEIENNIQAASAIGRMRFVCRGMLISTNLICQ